ncbi:MAG: hypothetical protein ACREIC_15725 [Limisphaerales bacterium]
MENVSRHIHIYLDSKWTGTITGTLHSGKKVSLSATVEASDAYQSGDKLKAQARRKFGEELYYPVIKFGREQRLSARSESGRALQYAGVEEDAAKPFIKLMYVGGQKGYSREEVEGAFISGWAGLDYWITVPDGRKISGPFTKRSYALEALRVIKTALRQ